MFKRFYAFGGVAYVLGGLGVLTSILGFAVLVVNLIPGAVSQGFFNYALIAILVGLAISTTIFNTGSMQVIAQNHTTEALERISQQLAEQAETDKLHRRNNRRPRQRKQAQEEPDVARIQERAETPVAEAAPQEGYHCPVTKTFIPIR